MTPLEIGAAVAVATVVVLLIGVPVAFALGGVTLGALLWLEGPGGLDAVAETFLGALEDFTLVAVPLFIVMGVAASLSAAGGDMREMIKRWLHNLPGGLIVANVCASALFSGLSSTGSATCMAVGRDGLPELRERRYADGLAAGAIAASGTLGILIPPSLTMIVYGIAADLSIGRLFLAGLLPGLMLTGLFAIWSLLAARRWRGRHGAFARGYSRGEMFEILPRALPFLAIVAGVLYALWTGIARPSEAAAVAATACVVFVAVIYRMWRPAELWRILRESTREAAAVLIIIASAALFAYMLAHFAVTDAVVGAVLELDASRWELILWVNVYLLIAGLFLPPVAVVLMSEPILLPLVVNAGFDPYWFAAVMMVNLQIGLLTPPVALNLRVVRALAPEVSVATAGGVRGDGVQGGSPLHPVHGPRHRGALPRTRDRHLAPGSTHGAQRANGLLRPRPGPARHGSAPRAPPSASLDGPAR
jgi:tripartite ATP-independent transporter DctM subunit